MRILFATCESYLPETIGGGVLGIHDLVMKLLEFGHDAEVVSGTRKNFVARCLRKLSGERKLGISDARNGYRTTRTADWIVPAVVRKKMRQWKPDVLVVQGQEKESLVAEAFVLGIPTIIRVVTAECVESVKKAMQKNLALGYMVRSGLVTVLSNSMFISGVAQDMLGVESPCIYELIRMLDDGTPSQCRPVFITFVNPIPIKGLNVVMKVAALLPKRKFLFAESWPLPNPAALKESLRTLPNVTFRPRAIGMDDVYRKTSLLLMPSQWREAFGRVIVEAGQYGIPSVASRIGGIPEAVGQGGVLLEPTQSPEEWAGEIENILSDSRRYETFSSLARLNSQRTEFQTNHLACRFIDLLTAKRKEALCEEIAAMDVA